MKTYKEFLEENLKKIGALKKQIKKTADSKDEVRLSKWEMDGHWDDGYGKTHQEVEDDYHDAEDDHLSNVIKTKKLAKDIRKDTRGQKHMGDMVKKGKQRSLAKRTNVDPLAKKSPITKNELVSSGKRRGKLTKSDQKLQFNKTYDRLKKKPY